MMDVERHCQQINGLLPWYVNRSLTTDEAEIVQAHLDDCEQCRDEAEWLAQAGIHLRSSRMQSAIPGEAESPVSSLRQRIAADRKERQRTGYALAAGMLLALAVTLGTVMAWQPLAPRYHTVTDPVAPATHAVMLEIELEPDAPLSTLYGILETHDAVIVAGPDARSRVVLEFHLAEGETAGSLVSALENNARVTRVRPGTESGSVTEPRNPGGR
ncbi:MAG TPA: zf-HC2 domain-containing protein [Gammaproteobacteria bacterium]